MYNRCRRRAGIRISLDMCHYIVSEFMFIIGSSCVILICKFLMCTQLRKLFVGNRKSQFLLTLRKGCPQLSPGRKFAIRAENMLHFLRCISCAKRIFVYFFSHKGLLVFSYILPFKALSINPKNSGCGLFGRLLNSGWNCTPTKKSFPGTSTVSTMLPSGEVPLITSPASARGCL